MLTASCAASCTARSRLIVTDGAGAPCTSLSTSTSAPFWLTLTTRQPASPSSSSMTDFFTSSMIAGAKWSSVGSSSACGVMTTPGRLPIAGATLSRSACRSVIRSSGVAEELACSARTLRIDGGVERTQRVGDGHRGRHQATGGGPRGLAVQRVVVQVAGHQHVAAAAFVDRGPRRRVGPQRECLMLAQVGVQSRCAPTDFPAPLVADHVELSVVGPGPLLGQMPGVAVVHAAGVLGVLRAEDHRVQSGGLQSGPGLVERGPGLRGLVAEVGGGSGVAVRERCEERLRGRFRTVGLRGARAECACGPDEDGHRQQTGDP